jgi:hypothetical protein
VQLGRFFRRARSLKLESGFVLQFSDLAIITVHVSFGKAFKCFLTGRQWDWLYSVVIQICEGKTTSRVIRLDFTQANWKHRHPYEVMLVPKRNVDGLVNDIIIDALKRNTVNEKEK